MNFEDFLAEARTPYERATDAAIDRTHKAHKDKAEAAAKEKGLKHVGGIYYADHQGQNLHKHPGSGRLEAVTGDAEERFKGYVKKGEFKLTAHGKKHFGHLQSDHK